MGHCAPVGTDSCLAVLAVLCKVPSCASTTAPTPAVPAVLRKLRLCPDTSALHSLTSYVFVLPGICRPFVAPIYEYVRTNGRTPNFKQPSTPQNQIPHPLNSGKTHFKQSPSFHFPTPTKHFICFFGLFCQEMLTSNAILSWILRSWSKMECSKWFRRLFCFRCISYQLCTTKFHQKRSRTPPEHVRGRV